MKSKKTSGALAVIVGSTIALGTALGSAPVRAEVELLGSFFLPPKHPFRTGIVVPWTRDVERVTEGRVKIAFAASSLAPPPKQWNMVTKGIADFAFLANAFEAKRLELVKVAQLPFYSPDAVASSVALWRTHRKFFLPANEYKGIKLVTLFTYGGANLWHSKKPLRMASDLEGEKMWALAGIPKATLDSMGAVVVTVPGVKMFSVVSKGVVDGLTTAEYALMTFKVNKFMKYGTLIPGGLSSVSFSILMNEKKWNSIPKQDQDLIDSISGEFMARHARKIDELDAKSIEIQKKLEIQREDASPEFMADLRKRLAPMEADWIKMANGKGVDGKAALEYYKAQVKELSM